MRRRSIFILLSLALLLVFGLGGTALASYAPKADPVIIDADCTWTHPVWPTYGGNYSFTVHWSLDAGKPVQWEVYVYDSSYNLQTSYGPGKLSSAQIKAGQATINLPYQNVGAGYFFRVWIGNRQGIWDYYDYDVGS